MRIVAVETASLSKRKDIAEGRAHLANLIGNFVFEPIDVVSARASAVGSWTRVGARLVEIERQNIVRSAIGIPVAFRRLLTVHIIDIIDGIFRIGIGITHDSDQ